MMKNGHKLFVKYFFEIISEKNCKLPVSEEFQNPFGMDLNK
jgi:hypothetical protein